MKAIVIVDKNWGIGKNNKLLFDIKEDMAHFRNITYGKIIVMGSSTFMSLPGSKPLKRRINIVLWPGGEKRDDCIVVESLEELAEKLKSYDSDDIFIIGGAQFYSTMLPYCDTAIVTKVDADGQAEVFFDNLDKPESGWLGRLCEGPYETESGHKIMFCTYSNPKRKDFNVDKK